MRQRKPITKKVISATAGQITRHEVKVSTDTRIKQLIDLLGIDGANYKLQSDIRKYSKMFQLNLINL